MNPLSTALTAMRRSPYQTMAAILTLSITFFVAYVFSFFLIGSEQILRYFETRPQIIGFFELTTSAETIDGLANSLQQKSFVSEVKVIHKDEALKMYQEDNKDDPLLLELVTADILPASIEVSGKDIESLAQIKKELENTATIEEVVFQDDLVEYMTKWTSTVRKIGIGSIAVLGINAFLNVLVIISMKVITKKQAINIMRIIGATKWYISMPFLYEGLIYGLIGSVIGWSGMIMLVLYLTPWLQEFLGDIKLLPVPYELFGLQLGIGTLIGMIFGGWIGHTAVRRLIKH